jgi:hypothetical protein
MDLRKFIFIFLFSFLACRAQKPFGLEKHKADGGIPTEGGDEVYRIPCDKMKDTDKDGVPDEIETVYDLDGDGDPNYLDEDSDGDGFPDAEEVGDSDPCTPPRDTDKDENPDYFDIDSDNDGLQDGEERDKYKTDPYNPDSDGDNFPDLAEIAAQTDPLDSNSTIPDTDFFVVLPYMAKDHEIRELKFSTDIKIADVLLLVDTTGSMNRVIKDIQESLRDIIVPGLKEQISDIQIGVAEFEDFPVDPDGSGPIMAYGYEGVIEGYDCKDRPFTLHQRITEDIDLVQEAVDKLNQPLGCGGDGPESHVEALYQVATGEGFSNWVEPSKCPDLPDSPYVGYPCFRNGALPIIILISDAAMHHGPADLEEKFYQVYNRNRVDYYYRNITPSPHTWDQMIEALKQIKARVIGLSIQGTPTSRPLNLEFMKRIAQATGTVDKDGKILAYESSATIGSEIVNHVATLAKRVPHDVDTITEDLPDRPPSLEIDGTGFIKRITPKSASPPAPKGFSHFDEATFYKVIPGTTVTFEIDFYNDFIKGKKMTMVYRALIVVRGNKVTRLDERKVYIIVPPGKEKIVVPD